MLGSHATTTAWNGLSIPDRIAVVIDRVAPIGGNDQVRDTDFRTAPETCDLDLDVIEANIGKATQILTGTGAPKVPTYNRELRIKQGLAAVAGLMPSRTDVAQTLSLAGFRPGEQKDLWVELVSRAADAWHAARGEVPLDIPDFARKMLEQNAD